MVKTSAQGYIEEGMQIGALEQAKKALIRFGQKRFGPISDSTRETINALTSIERLDRMLEQHDTVASWADLLAIQ